MCFVFKVISQERKCICFPFWSNFSSNTGLVSYCNWRPCQTVWSILRKKGGFVLRKTQNPSWKRCTCNNFYSRMKCIVMNCVHKHELSHNYGSQGMALRCMIATSITFQSCADEVPLVSAIRTGSIMNPLCSFHSKETKVNKKYFSSYCQHFHFLFPSFKEKLIVIFCTFWICFFGFFPL